MDKFHSSHIALRIAAHTKIKGRYIDIIQSHNEIFTPREGVAFAKFGKGWSLDKCKEFSQIQCLNGKSFLYAISKIGKEVQVVRAPIAEVLPGDQRPSAPVPEYYDKLVSEPGLRLGGSALARSPGMWFVLSKPFTPSKIDSLILESNSRLLLEVVLQTRTSMMLVRST